MQKGGLMRQQLSLFIDADKVKVGRHHCVFWEGQSIEMMWQAVEDVIDRHHLWARHLWLVDAGLATINPLHWYWLKLIWGQHFWKIGGHQLHFREVKPQINPLVPADLPWMLVQTASNDGMTIPWRTRSFKKGSFNQAQPVGYQVENMKTGQLRWVEGCSNPTQTMWTLVEGLRAANGEVVAYQLNCQGKGRHDHLVSQTDWSCYTDQDYRPSTGRIACQPAPRYLEFRQQPELTYPLLRKRIKHYWQFFWKSHGIRFSQAKQQQNLYNRAIYKRQAGFAITTANLQQKGVSLDIQSVLHWQRQLMPWLSNPEEEITHFYQPEDGRLIKVRFQAANIWLWTSHRLTLNLMNKRRQVLQRQQWNKLDI
ncbi:hypothetical protein [Weissella halotolerans]|nr:hypothetical protein [Weissella halotolerans]